MLTVALKDGAAGFFSEICWKVLVFPEMLMQEVHIQMATWERIDGVTTKTRHVSETLVIPLRKMHLSMMVRSLLSN